MGAVIAHVGDWQIAEDAVQDAAARALEVWERDGVPVNPAGWLVVTARRRGVDLLRRAQTREATAHRFGIAVELGLLDTDASLDGEIDDDRLRLICTCAHPALTLESRTALTLRTVLGMPASAIAALLLTTEAAVLKRLVRARAKIAHARIPYRVPSGRDLSDRVDGVLAVAYLLFTSGYAHAISGADATAEAIRLVRLLAALLEEDEALETRGLLALMLLQDSRRGARTASDGTLVELDDQDRSLWDRAAIDESHHLLDAVVVRAAHTRIPVGRYTLQAAIAFEHARAEDPADTDWGRLAALHDVLARIAPSPSQALARSVAVGRSSGPKAGLDALTQSLADHPTLINSHLFHAARGDVLRRAERTGEARAEFSLASQLAPTEAERAQLSRRTAV